MQYDSGEYANSRLNDSYVRDEKGKVVKVLRVDEDFKTIVQDGVTLEERWTTLDKLDLKPMPLGYINFDQPQFLSRMPRRDDWRQGLRMRTTRGGRNFLWKPLPEQFQDMVDGKYPSFKEALQSVRDRQYRGRAFDRFFCLYKFGGNVDIHYAANKIATIDKDDQIIWYPNFIHLKERFERIVK